MSEKKAKEQRKLNNSPTLTIKIEVYPDNRVEVGGFPMNYYHAVDIMQAGIKRISSYFIVMAREGKVDDKLCLAQDLIIKPPAGMAIPFPTKH